MLWEKRGQLALGAQGYVHAPKSGLFSDHGTGCTAPLDPTQLTPLPQGAQWPPRAATWASAHAVPGTTAQVGAAGLLHHGVMLQCVLVVGLGLLCAARARVDILQHSWCSRQQTGGEVREGKRGMRAPDLDAKCKVKKKHEFPCTKKKESTNELFYRQLGEFAGSGAPVLTADFNFPDISWEHYPAVMSRSQKFLNSVGVNFLSEVMSEAARTDTLLDLTVVNRGLVGVGW